MKVSHEVPFNYLELSLRFNDYDYALVHLFDKYPEYVKFFKKSINDGREVILDNSAYEISVTPELKEKYPAGYYDMDKYAKWIEEVRPTYYILPDSKGDVEKSIELAYKFINEYPSHGLTIGVVHGNSLEEMKDCYKEMTKIADKIAFSFEKWQLEGAESTDIPYIRYRTIEKIGIDESIPHHLLGCINPLEFSQFKDCKWLDSIDTSAPITHALQKETLSVETAYKKPKITIHDMFEIERESKYAVMMQYNARVFKSWLK